MTFVTEYDLELINSIKCVIAIPSYNEVTSLPILIKELSLVLNSDDAVLILDDSPLDNQEKIKSLVTNSFSDSKGMLLFLNSDKNLVEDQPCVEECNFVKGISQILSIS